MHPTQVKPEPDPPPRAPKEKSSDVTRSSLKATVAVMLSFSASFAVYILVHGTTRPIIFGWSDVSDPTPLTRLQPHDGYATNISHIAFGIGGSTRTWAKRGGYSNIWWRPGRTRGFVFLDEEPDGELRNRFKIRHRVSSDWRRFRHTAGSDSAVRIARIVVDLFRTGLPDVRWFVMGDDDTVFFPENVVAVLAKYDHRQMVYVGGNSESVEQDVMHAYDMAFGGGGFAISYPLAAALVSAMDGCLDRYHFFYGSDQRVWACAADFGVGLSRESGFHQIDIKGDPFGLLVAHPVAPLVSLHHLDYVKSLFPGKSQMESLKTLMQAYKVDPSRTLQQCFCYHTKHQWSVSISWGYAVLIYPIVLNPIDLKKPLLTFKTWRTESDGPFTFNTRRLDPNPCRRPIVFNLDSIKRKSGGKTKTRYRKFKGEPRKNCDESTARAMAVDEIVVLASTMDPQEWTQRPRRHCCEIMKGNSTAGRVMNLRVRKCKDEERIFI